MSLLQTAKRLHDRAFGAVEATAGTWFLGLAARFVFSSVLLVYFLNSAATKLGAGFPGIFVPAVGAYAQILPTVAEAAGYDPSMIAFFPWKIVVFAGTYAELLLPLLIFAGLFTRLASVAMIGLSGPSTRRARSSMCPSASSTPCAIWAPCSESSNPFTPLALRRAASNSSASRRKSARSIGPDVIAQAEQIG